MPRPPGYDRDAVIAEATVVFWERGYSRTSIGDLVRATGLNPGSLYAAFGSKKGVFLEVLDQYNRRVLDRLGNLRAGGRPPLAAIARLLEEIAEETAAGSDRRGCLSVNTLLEMAHHDAEIASRVSGHLEELRRVLAGLLREAQGAGDVAPERDPEALAAFIVNNIWGMRVMCKSRPSRPAMQGIVDNVMRALSR